MNDIDEGIGSVNNLGQKHGLWIRYWWIDKQKTNRIAQKINFENGRLNGWARTYYSTGKQMFTEFYVNGIIIYAVTHSDEITRKDYYIR